MLLVQDRVEIAFQPAVTSFLLLHNAVDRGNSFNVVTTG